MPSDLREESFRSFFKIATGGFSPHHWQSLVALDGLPELLAVPTGLGKTEVALAWAWRRLAVGEPEPLHLVYCLPMRSLVAQTVQRLTGYFQALRAHDARFDVSVHQLMGGSIDEAWVRWPDKPWVLVGTQDQLLSRALNRGYAMSRFEWPVHFGLLNNDCRWLVDEVQLMGPGLWTTAQLDWMRSKRFPALKACPTTWMSATVGPSFLGTADRTREQVGEPSHAQRAFDEKLKQALGQDPNLGWWREARRPVEWTRHNTAEALAREAEGKHQPGTLSLIVCNTVEAARAVFRAVKSEHKILLTSRFRRRDRSQHEQQLIAFDAARKARSLKHDDPGLICVATQVVEAGVDVSAHRLWSELAPWASVLQRLGRLNRRGEDQEARAWFWETPKEKRGARKEPTGPYDPGDVARAKKLVDGFVALSQAKPFVEALADLGMTRGDEIEAALNPKPSPLPRALDVHGLFSTERDVHGGFTDISAFVRGTDPDVDVTVFWREWSGDRPPRDRELDGPLLDPAHEGCPVSSRRVAEMLKLQRTSGWLWNDEAESWERVFPGDIRPGMVVMLRRDVGGYDTAEGWTGDRKSVIAGVPRAGRGEALRDDAWTEVGHWSKLEDHLKDGGAEAESLCAAVSLKGQLRDAVVNAAGFHDLGKAHPQWLDALPDRTGIPDVPLAKCPRVVAADVAGDPDVVRAEFARLRSQAHALSDEPNPDGRKDVVRLRWAIDDRLSDEELKSLRTCARVRWAGHMQFRPGLRHEVASALAMWGRYRDSETKPYPALAVYLAASHHGKARTVMRSTPGRADNVFGVTIEPTTLAIGDDEWALDFSIAKDGAEGRWEGNEFVLTGHGWTGLVADLLGPWRPEEKSEAGVVPEAEPRQLGPFALAYLEALVRIADRRASAQPSASIKPSEVSNGR